MKNNLTQKELKDALSYNRDTGEFVWKHRKDKSDYWNRRYSNTKCGTRHSKGYIVITVNVENYKAHRLAWLYEYGRWPEGQLDHINGIRDDNRISNLRECDAYENARNRKIHSNNTTGHKGVSIDNYKKSKFRAKITKDYKVHHLGYYQTAEEARQAYCDAVEEYHGEFSRVE